MSCTYQTLKILLIFRKIKTSASQPNKSSSNMNLHDASLSMALSTSSLENVTQLSDKHQVATASDLPDSPSSFSSSSSDSVTHSSASSSPTKKSSLKNDSGKQQPTSDRTHHKQKAQFNLSLFDSSLSNASLPSPLDPNEPCSKFTFNQNSSSYNNNNTTNFIEYGALIYDSLLTNNLTQSTQSTTQNLTSSMQQQTPMLLKPEPNAKHTMNNSQINSKKWFDILASGEHSLLSASASSSALSQSSMNVPKSASNLAAEAESSLNSLTQYSILSEHSSSVADSKRQDGDYSFEKTLPAYQSPNLKSTGQVGNNLVF